MPFDEYFSPVSMSTMVKNTFKSPQGCSIVITMIVDKRQCGQVQLGRVDRPFAANGCCILDLGIESTIIPCRLVMFNVYYPQSTSII